MRLFTNLRSWFRPSPEPSTELPKRAIGIDGNGNPINLGSITAPTTLAGVNVSERSALTLSTVYRAARVLSESVGTMPIKVYRRTEDGREENREHPLWAVVHDEPNPEQSAVDFFCLMQWWAVLYGNAYAEIVRDGSGQVAQLWPVPPEAVRAVAGGYEVTIEGGSVFIGSADMMHIKGPSPDGSEGYRLVTLARQSLGYSIALDRYGAAHFGNGCRPGGALKYPGEISPEDKEKMRQSWLKQYAGPDNANGIAVLDNGLEYVPFEHSNDASQYVQSRQAEIYSVCRWLGVDPIFLYEYGRATWNNAEAQTRNFLQFSLNPWLKKYESELMRKGLNKAERSSVYVEFVRESLIQMDTLTQHKVWDIGIKALFYEQNEIRKFLNLPKLKEVKPIQPPTNEQPGDNGQENNPDHQGHNENEKENQGDDNGTA